MSRRILNRGFALTTVITTLVLTQMNLCFAQSVPAETIEKPQVQASVPAATPEANLVRVHEKGPVGDRAKKEEKITPNSFTIAFYKPTYIMPVYYTASPYNSIYTNHTPESQSIKSLETKFQLSFKVPVWRNIYNYPSTLYLAYTQLSYWQLYTHDAFFRETDYEPELFLANEVNIHLFRQWNINFLNLGAEHQSNGFGGTMERSWNRIYIEAISSTGNWLISVKPWYILNDSTKNQHNPNIGQFLGYGQFLVGYKHGNQLFSITAHNLIEAHARRATAQLTWTFPITPYIKGYAQVFSGYGQSLIEYDHRTNSVGLGLSLSDWV